MSLKKLYSRAGRLLLLLAICAVVTAQTDEQPFLLQEAVRRAAQESPSVKAARHRWQAARQGKTIALSLPDPRLSYTDFLRSVETRTGPQRYSLALSQSLPFPSKLITSGRMAEREEQIAYLSYQAAMRDAVARAKELYFELYYIDRAQQVSQAVLEIYTRYAQLALGGEEGQAVHLADRFRAETQAAQLGYDLMLLQEMRRSEADRLRAVLALGADRALGPTQQVRPPLPLGTPVSQLQDVAAAYNQELKAAGLEVERARLASSLARQSYIPDLTFSANYINVGPALNPSTPDAGRDPFGLGVGISIPLWFWKNRAHTRRAKEEEMAAQAEQEARRLNLRAEVSRAYFQLVNAARLTRLYNDTLLPQARQAQQSAEQLYRSGQAPLASLLETAATYHNFELAQLRATADYYQAVARLERLLGRAFHPQASNLSGAEGGNEAKDER
ncbi:MAG TPA: TolC family protein [Acidobacteriota bacterium]|nr:TolC family protein [Acidobacteriota bacterium]